MHSVEWTYYPIWVEFTHGVKLVNKRYSIKVNFLLINLLSAYLARGGARAGLGLQITSLSILSFFR